VIILFLSFFFLKFVSFVLYFSSLVCIPFKPHEFVRYWCALTSTPSTRLILVIGSFIFSKVSRRLLPLQLEWSLRSLVEHCPLLTANSLGSLDQLRDPLTTTFAAPPSVTQSEATESAGAAVAAITTWARAQPHLHITHVPIGIDKLDLRSCETSGTSSSSARTSGIRDENGGAVIGTSVGDGDDTNGDRNDDHDSSVPSSMLSSSPSTHAGAPMRALVAWGALTPDETTTTAGASSGKDGGDNDEDDDDDEEGNNNGAADVAPAEAMVEAATTGAEDSLALTVVR